MKYWEMGECFACAVDIALADGVLEEEKDIINQSADVLNIPERTAIPIRCNHPSVPLALPGMSISASSGRPGVVISSASRSSGNVSGKDKKKKENKGGSVLGVILALMS